MNTKSILIATLLLLLASIATGSQARGLTTSDSNQKSTQVSGNKVVGGGKVKTPTGPTAPTRGGPPTAPTKRTPTAPTKRTPTAPTKGGTPTAPTKGGTPTGGGTPTAPTQAQPSAPVPAVTVVGVSFTHKPV